MLLKNAKRAHRTSESPRRTKKLARRKPKLGKKNINADFGKGSSIYTFKLAKPPAPSPQLKTPRTPSLRLPDCDFNNSIMVNCASSNRLESPIAWFNSEKQCLTMKIILPMKDKRTYGEKPCGSLRLAGIQPKAFLM